MYLTFIETESVNKKHNS